MATSYDAIAALIRAEAMLMTGRVESARGLFLQAKAGDPMLSEADAGLAAAATCLDFPDDAKRFVRRSWQRSDDPLAPGDDVTQHPQSVDLDHGLATELRDLPLPADPAEAAALVSYYDDALLALQDETDQEGAERQEILQRMSDAQRSGEASYAEIVRRDRLSDLQWDDQPADLQELADRAEAARTAADDARIAFHDGWAALVSASHGACAQDADPTACGHAYRQQRCPDLLAGSDTAWREAMGTARSAGAEWFRLRSTRMSAYAANLAGTDAHRLAALEIQGVERDLTIGLAGLADDWSRAVRVAQVDCIDGGADQDAPNLPTRPEVRTDACPAGLADVDVSVELAPITLERTCERITLQSHESRVDDLALAFRDAAWQSRLGTLTVVFGADPDQQVGGFVAGRGAGVYATVAPYDGITDLGWRMAPGATVGHGRLEAALTGRYDLAILPGLAPVPRLVVDQPL